MLILLSILQYDVYIIKLVSITIMSNKNKDFAWIMQNKQKIGEKHLVTDLVFNSQFKYNICTDLYY